MKLSTYNHSLFLLITVLFPSALFAQGIRGTITDTEGEALPYATIYIKQLETGTSTNIEGKYEYRLPAGQYELLYQYLGYESVTKQVTIQQDFIELDIALQTQVIQLREVQVNAKAEDPAYTIIRKAIAKSKFHTLQVDKYTAQVYIKGAGRVKDVPFFLRKKLAKEGLDTSVVYLTESVSEISYERPNTFNERVISIRTIGDSSNNVQSPNSYIQGSFYDPKIGDAISPLSPRAFAYYRFKYEGSFFDREYEVNKIKVVPRVKSDNVFSGYIYIIENLWSIHSLDLSTYTFGFKFDIEQIYAPIKEAVFLPVNHQFNIAGKFLGFDVAYKYLATVSNYDITLNPDLEIEELEVVDEKIEKELAKALEAESKLEEIPDGKIDEVFTEKKKFTRKELRKTLKEYEKELEKIEEEPDLIEVSTMTIDSLAGNQDSVYWANIRPVPLNEKEVISYQKLDSMTVAQAEKEAEKDSLTISKKRKGGFHPENLLFGTSYKVGKKSRFTYKSPITTVNFNTVEGYHFDVPFEWTTRFDTSKRLIIAPSIRYAFAREKVTGRVKTEYRYNRKKKYGSFQIEGGRYVHQLNEANPISPAINTLASLLFERNFLKPYEKDYLKLSLSQKLSKGLVIQPSIEWAERTELFNNTNRRWRNVDNRAYTPNAPFNNELVNTNFPTHQALLLGLKIDYLPIVKYKMRNGKKREYTADSPKLRLEYRKGVKDVAGSDVDFDVLELGIQHQFKLGLKGRLDYNIYAGSFLNRNQMYFMDFQHFMGNQTFLQISTVESFRLLDYYQFSTQRNYLGAHLYYQFRKLLLTQIWEVRLAGLKENIILNYLKTGGTDNIISPIAGEFPSPEGADYMEIGYSIDNIFRFFRIEAIASFEEFEYKDFGIRVGISTNIEDLFNFE